MATERKDLLHKFKFGDYVTVEQNRYGAPNEHFVHKVIGALESNSYIDVPITYPELPTLHNEVVPILRLICCGICEEKVIRVRVEDCRETTMRG